MCDNSWRTPPSMARRPTVLGPTKQATRGMCTPIYLQCGHIGPWNNIETPKNTKQCIPLENADSRLVICLHSKHIYMILHALPRWSTWFYMILHEISIIPVSRISHDAFSSNGDLGRGLDPRCVSASPWVSGWRGLIDLAHVELGIATLLTAIWTVPWSKCWF